MRFRSAEEEREIRRIKGRVPRKVTRPPSAILCPLAATTIYSLYLHYISFVFASSFPLSLSLSLLCPWPNTQTTAPTRTHKLSIAAVLSAVIGPWCHTMGQTMLGTIHPLLLNHSTLASHLLAHPSSPVPTPFRGSTTPILSRNQPNPSNLINVIADCVTSRSQWDVHEMEIYSNILGRPGTVIIVFERICVVSLYKISRTLGWLASAIRKETDSDLREQCLVEKSIKREI